ncbi:hypothetical protein N656DRAFT_773053 [Canariomyces notabilis]|jgi:hypothetical protein|uniref:Uncharacterized protein n=1 Tax=Canariomyces notabilis TaxID=2074819 RepID=A0AAN6TMP2_9PEZI|nr:hypothetical protein N656DRAFT_773053 [Canariomyces arenarius]
MPIDIADSNRLAVGRMAEGGNIPGFTPLVRNGHSRPLSSDMRGGLPSPLTMGSSMGTGITSSPSELDSTPCYGEVAGDSGPRSEAAELESLPATQDEKIAEPRATLKSTQEERQSGTYANSWTRFHNLQL